MDDLPSDRQAVTAGGLILSKPWSIDFFGVCVDECPKTGQYVCTREAEALVEAFMIKNGVSKEQAVMSIETTPGVDGATVNKGCFKTLFDNIGILFRCVPRYVYDVEVLVNESVCVESQTLLVHKRREQDVHIVPQAARR